MQEEEEDADAEGSSPGDDAEAANGGKDAKDAGAEGEGGDGSLNDPEEGSMLDKFNDMKDIAIETYQTDPSEWTTGQKVGVAIGALVAFMLLVCLVKCCCCKKKA